MIARPELWPWSDARPGPPITQIWVIGGPGRASDHGQSSGRAII